METGEKHKNTYILAHDVRRAARAEEYLLPRAESMPTSQSPCLHTVKPVKPNSVSFFNDCSPNNVKRVTRLFEDNLCPTLVHVPSKYKQTKSCPVVVSTYIIEDDSSHYKQKSLDVIDNRAIKTDFRRKHPDFKKTNPGLRCLGANDDHDYDDQNTRQSRYMTSDYMSDNYNSEHNELHAPSPSLQSRVCPFEVVHRMCLLLCSSH